MEDFEAGTAALLDLVKSLDRDVEVVIPTAPSNGRFLISLTKGAGRKFLTVPEDDILDLPSEADVRDRTTAALREAAAGL